MTTEGDDGANWADVLSRTVPLDHVVPGMEVQIEADATECAAIAARLGEPALHSLRCRFRLLPVAGGAEIVAEGELSARLTRLCGVSLELFETPCTEAFTLLFVPRGAELDGEDPEAPDRLAHDGVAIDLGAATAEQLALALDPYPRNPAAVLPAGVAEPVASPFAALARRRPGKA